MNANDFDFDWGNELEQKSATEEVGSQRSMDTIVPVCCSMINITYICGHLRRTEYQYCGGSHLNTPDCNRSCHDSAPEDKRLVCDVVTGPDVCENPCKILTEGWHCCTCGYIYVGGVVHPVTGKAVHESDDGSIHMFCDECTIKEPATYQDRTESVCVDMGTTIDETANKLRDVKMDKSPTPPPVPIVPGRSLTATGKIINTDESVGRSKTPIVGESTVVDKDTARAEPSSGKMHMRESMDNAAIRDARPNSSMDYDKATYKAVRETRREIRHRLRDIHEDLNKPKPKSGLASFFSNKPTNTGNSAAVKALRYTSGYDRPQSARSGRVSSTRRRTASPTR